MEENRSGENLSLSALLETEKDMVMAQLSGDRSQESAAMILEKEADRLMFRVSAPQAQQEAAAQGMLQVLKHAAGLVASVSEAETWEKNAGAGSRSGFHVPGKAIGCMIAGAVLAMMGLAGTGGGILGTAGLAAAGRVLLRILFTSGGCALFFLGGRLSCAGRGDRKTASGKEKQIQQTFLVDPPRIWHILQGTILGIDHMLENVGEQADNRSTDSDVSGKTMEKNELAFFSELLEHAYALRRRFPADAALTEQVEHIRFYLYERGITTEDYSAQSAAWFEVLPSGDTGKAVTIRPALVRDGKVIKKGVAAGGVLS